MLSTHKVEVVRIRKETHPNADSLSVVNVFGGYPCCVRTADWEDGDLAAYIPPDSVVDVSRPEFKFLASGTKTKHRVKCVKLRGVHSYGLLVNAPDGAAEGDDVAEAFGIEHYEPQMRGECTGGEAVAAPAKLSQLSRYDVDSMRRYSKVFIPGERVMVTEKIHGANSRYCFWDGQMWCGSRSEWKKDDGKSVWWKALTDEMREFCMQNPGCVLYGEVYGKVQGLQYGVQGVRFAAFDVLDVSGSFKNAWAARALVHAWRVEAVPLVEEMPFDFDAICELAEGPSLVFGADHIREGVVVKPIEERFHQSVGRVILKVVGSGYLERK